MREEERRLELLGRIREVWDRMPIPDWPPMEGEFEEAELSRLLSGLSYRDMFSDQCLSESVLMWCRPDVATYYLGGYLLRAVDNLSDPWRYIIDYFSQTTNDFLTVNDWLYRKVYMHLLEMTPEIVPVVHSYGQLLKLLSDAGPPAEWIPGSPWPEEHSLIERIITAWSDRESLAEIVGTLRMTP